jgi:hypothetical protein
MPGIEPQKNGQKPVHGPSPFGFSHPRFASAVRLPFHFLLAPSSAETLLIIPLSGSLPSAGRAGEGGCIALNF